MLPRYRHVIWDWNGTLVDDADASVAAINTLLRARGLQLLDLPRYRAVFDFPVRDYYVRIGFDLEAESFERAALEYLEHYELHWRSCSLRHGAREVLGALAARGVTHSVLSATEHAMLREQSRHHALEDLIGAWVGLDDKLAGGKLAAGQRWLAQQPLAPEQVVLVGDTLHDHEVARQLGVDCVLLEGGHHGADRLHASGAPVCRDLYAVLRTVTEA